MSPLKAMSENERRLFAIFNKALQAERDAQAMYQEAMGLCEDPMLRAVLKGFYEDEIRHEQGVLARYHQFRNEYQADGN